MNPPDQSVAGETSGVIAPAAPAVQPLAPATVKIETENEPPDPSSSIDQVSAAQWNRLSDQRDVMIKAMVSVFTWLNGGFFAFTVAAWIGGLFLPTAKIVDTNTIMALIGATVVQAGIAFVAITRFLFPGPKGADKTI